MCCLCIADMLINTEDTVDDVNMILVLGATVGGLVFFLILMVMCITYIQAKKAKEIRRNSRLRRGHSTSRVQPFSHGMWTILDGPAPPAYGEIYSSPMSPPPAYCTADPNPSPEGPLPGRPQFMADRQVNRQVTHVIQVHNADGDPAILNHATNGASVQQPPSRETSSTTSNAIPPNTNTNNSRLQVPNSTNVPQSQSDPFSYMSRETQMTGNIAPLATQSLRRGVTINRHTIDTTGVVPLPAAADILARNENSNENVVDTEADRRSYSSISVVSLPDSQYSEVSEEE